LHAQVPRRHRGRQHPGCEATAQFPAGRENCVTPEHFLLAGAAIYRQIRPAAADWSGGRKLQSADGIAHSYSTWIHK